MDAAAAAQGWVERWIEAWERAWPVGDVETVAWWAVMVAPDGSEETIAGTSLLRFGADGRVVEQRDVWAIEPGARDLPDWAR